MLIGRTIDLPYFVGSALPVHEGHGDRLESIVRLPNGEYEFKFAGKRESIETMAVHWYPVEEFCESEFVSVLGYMIDSDEFPQVRECYKVGPSFYFPALQAFHPISHWMPMPTRRQKNE